jgi:branched-chain amino acid transport system ATP-binding protein
MTPAVEVQNLSSGYGRIPILNSVQFQVDPGEVLGILGHNGMGKTTLLLGYVPQGRQIFPHLSAYDNLRMGCAAGGVETIIEEVLSRFARLRRLLARSGGTLSGGEQQLLALARCLCGAPKIMLLDEPSEGIQPSILDEIAEVLAQIKSSAGTSMILVEQNVEFLAALADRVLIIYRGRIVAELPGSEITMHTMDQHIM